MSALVRLAREGARSLKLSRFLPKQNNPTRLCHDSYRKKALLQDLKEVGKYEELKEYQQSWVSYGFDKQSKALDRHYMHAAMFCAITLFLITGGVAMAYAPDIDLKHWSQREAFLQLRYREENNLPLIDPNFIDPARIVLPSDEELGSTEIII